MKKFTIVSILIGVAISLSFLSSAFSKQTKKRFHSDNEIIQLRNFSKRAPIDAGEYFLPSSSCAGCHGFDSAGVANIDESGFDVNLVERWESSMMAMSSKDPLWRAKVSHEILTNPAHSGDLQNKCTSCHAPMGRYTSMFHGNPYYGISDINSDSLGMDGVSCGACHKIDSTTGFTFSGEIKYDTNLVEYGPFTAPFVGPMQLYEGFTPVYSTHMNTAKLCASCHTLITETVDLSGTLTGGHFVEQATYHEFENSNFPSNNIICQTCHMPQNNDGIIIANGFLGLTPRLPFNQHKFAGANSFMLNIIKNNRDSVHTTVPVEKFDSTIIATLDLLKNKSINLHTTLDSITADTAYFRVKLENKVGHKFPSGYPARRAVVQFVALDANNDTVFQSGIYNSQYRVMGETPAYEPHHSVINQSGVSQIYELVMGDVNGDFTSLLERAAVLLKDNRLPPAGFTTSHSTYDTCIISADAIADADFNKTGTVQGSGIDYVHFHVPLAGAVGHLNIKTKIFYQSVPPKWLDEMFGLNSAPINTFRTMYNNADKTPVLIAKDSINNINLSVGIPKYSIADVAAYPTLSMDGRILVNAGYGTLIKKIEVLDGNGKLIQEIINTNYQNNFEIYLPNQSGIYFIRISTDKNIVNKKIVRS